MSLKKYFLIIVAVAALKVTMIAANAVPAFAEDISLLHSVPQYDDGPKYAGPSGGEPLAEYALVLASCPNGYRFSEGYDSFEEDPPPPCFT